jgi:cell division protease FtsH
MSSTMAIDEAAAAESLRPLALLATGMSGADIERLIREVRARCRRKGETFTWDILEKALRQDDDRLSDAIRHRIAVHEIGHALASELTGVGKVVSVRIHGLSGKTGAQVDRELAQFPEGMDVNLICILAGRAAEAVVFGDKALGSGGGEGSDLALATRIAIDLETAFGIGEGHPLLYRPPSTTGDILHYNPLLAERVHGRLEQAEQRAEELLRPHRELIEALGRQLVESRVLEGATIRAALTNVNALDSGGTSDGASLRGDGVC